MSTGSANNTIAGSQYAKVIRSTSPVTITKVKKRKKMGWFKRKFAQWSREAWENSRSEEVYATDTIAVREGINGKSSVRFTVYPASGGFVIESYRQDRYKDSDGPTLTIVNHGDELGKTVEHIIAMEALRS